MAEAAEAAEGVEVENLPPEDRPEAIQAALHALLNEDREEEEGAQPATVEAQPATEKVSLPAAGKENQWSRQGGDEARSLRLRPQASLRATARLRSRSQRRNDDRRSRSRGMARKKT